MEKKSRNFIKSLFLTFYYITEQFKIILKIFQKISKIFNKMEKISRNFIKSFFLTLKYIIEQF